MGHASTLRVAAMPSLEKVSGGNDFQDFYVVEYRPLLALAAAMTGNRAEAEELVQEALLRVCVRWSRVCRYERPGAFARRVLLNLATSRTRRLAAEARALRRIGRARDVLDGPESSSCLPFWEALRSLPRRQAQVLALFYLEDRPVRGIAEVLGCTEETVRSHMHAGRRSLAAKMEIKEQQDG